LISNRSTNSLFLAFLPIADKFAYVHAISLCVGVCAPKLDVLYNLTDLNENSYKGCADGKHIERPTSCDQQ